MKRYIILFLSMVFISTSCDKYLDINESPNGAVTPPMEGLLSNVTYNSSINVYRLGYTTSYYVQYNASPNPGSLTDTYQRVNTEGFWNGVYNVSSDIFDLMAFGEENESPHFVGVGKILMAMNLGLAVDVYGDLPYSEAFDFSTITPKYDEDTEIYQQVFNLLDEGIAELQKEEQGILLESKNDFIHQGDVEAWIKTAYALKARYLNHYSKTPDYNPSEILNALSHAYESNNDNSSLTEFKTRNPWNDVALDNARLVLDGWLSTQLIEAMDGTTFGVFDPRLPLITSPLDDGSYVGTRNGVGREGDGTGERHNYITVDGFYTAEDAPLYIITYSELKFIEAEVYMRENQPNEAYAAYLEGILSNMEEMGVTQGDSNAYINSGTVSVGASNLTLKTIFKEKYVAMFLHPEAWVDARRIDYDYEGFELPVGAEVNLNGEFIRRIDYPDAERQRNDSNIPTKGSYDELLTKPIFWDQ